MPIPYQPMIGGPIPPPPGAAPPMRPTAQTPKRPIPPQFSKKRGKKGGRGKVSRRHKQV